MSRQIRFRAWDIERRKMVYKFADRGWAKDCYRLLYDSGKMICGNYLDNGDWNEPELMQFVNWIDKKKKEIWEGDIITYDLMEGLGQPEKRGLKRVVKMRATGAIGGWDSNIQVIGNIYETPDLLK